MVQRVVLDGLWCGQGMANMVRVFANSAADPKTAAADWLCIFDFGSGGLSASKKVLKSTPPVDAIMAQLERQAAAHRNPRIDLLLISHQDRDHWQLLGELYIRILQLNEKIEPDDLVVEVKQVALAGTDWLKGAKSAVKKFEDMASKPTISYTGQYSSFDDPDAPGAPIVVGDMRVRTMVTNVASAKTGKSSIDIRRNCSSAIALLQLAGTGFILPGDATWETLAELKKIMVNWPESPVPFIYAASVPHHGALRTMNRKSSVTAPDLRDLVWFTEYTQPKSIYASAGFWNTHCHPYLVVLDTMKKYATDPRYYPARPIIVFNGVADDFQLIPDARDNVYTSVLNLTSPVRSANWIFNITPTTVTTEMQPFLSGVPGIYSAPQFLEEVLAAGLAGAASDPESMDVSELDTVVGDTTFYKVVSGPTMLLADAMRGSAQPPAPPPARAAVYHFPLATAGAAREERRPPPPLRVAARARTG